MKGYVLSVRREIAAPPEAIFDVLSDSAQHSLIDGSGMLQGAKEPPERLALGSKFGMGMKLGVRYSTVNRVVEFEENRRIAWQSRPGGFVGKYVAGRIWRYELDPVEGGTLVRESWDISQDHQRAFLRLGGLPDKTAANMAKTLGRIEEIVTTT
jgi:uncharacterized protein YndB with AHSA1/START domain